MDYLEEFSLEEGFVIPESLIVKNIENIQGDEKDVIIFSTVYAPDLKGKMNMNFGSLNMEGGENRLNVAVTRAREKIYLVTSIMPQELKVEKSKKVAKIKKEEEEEEDEDENEEESTSEEEEED